MNKIKIFEKQIDECNKIIEKVKGIKEDALKEIENLKKDKKEKWKPENGNLYWYYNKDLEACVQKLWEGDKWDKFRLENTVIFKTSTEVERYANYQKAKKEYTYEFSEEEWKNPDIKKHSISYDFTSKSIKIDYTISLRYWGEIYFASEEKAQEFIDKYREEILGYEFGIVGD